MAGQFSFNGTLEKALDYSFWSDKTETHVDSGIDAIAIAPHFWGYLRTEDNIAEVEIGILDG